MDLFGRRRQEKSEALPLEIFVDERCFSIQNRGASEGETELVAGEMLYICFQETLSGKWSYVCRECPDVGRPGELVYTESPVANVVVHRKADLIWGMLQRHAHIGDLPKASYQADTNPHLGLFHSLSIRSPFHPLQCPGGIDQYYESFREYPFVRRAVPSLDSESATLPSVPKE